MDWIGSTAGGDEQSAPPLFVCFSPIVAWRAYYHGLGLLERRTAAAIAPSAPLRLRAIWLTLLILPHFPKWPAQPLA
ncbi:MAG: hypothetical protein R2867_36820 [Caldilineaceae bacterium]